MSTCFSVAGHEVFKQLVDLVDLFLRLLTAFLGVFAHDGQRALELTCCEHLHVDVGGFLGPVHFGMVLTTPMDPKTAKGAAITSSATQAIIYPPLAATWSTETVRDLRVS